MKWHKYWDYYSYLKFCNLHFRDKLISFEDSIYSFLKEFFNVETQINLNTKLSISIIKNGETIELTKIPKWVYALLFYITKHKPETYAMLRLNFVAPTSSTFISICEQKGFKYHG